MSLATPVWTSLMVYYVEGDRGHLMTEVAFKAQSARAARGNAVSFPLPWEDMLTSMSQASTTPGELELPHDPKIICALVRLHLKCNDADLSKYVEQVKIRAHVVMHLIMQLVVRQHPYFARIAHSSELELHQKLQARFVQLYPEARSRLRDFADEGFVPAEIMEEIETFRKRKQRESSRIYEKNATPAEGFAEWDQAIMGIRPAAVIEERTSSSSQEAHFSRSIKEYT